MALAGSIAALDWNSVASDLDSNGYALTKPLLSKAMCRSIGRYYDDSNVVFRSTIDMARYNFGSGQYRYFDYPLPDPVSELRAALYPPLAAIANRWSELLGSNTTWPGSLDDFSRECHAAGQCRPTPLLLRYGAGDYNCLHQDLYGDLYFPLQVIFMLSDPQADFDGGQLVLVEQRPRMQSRPNVVNLQQESAAIIPVRERPRQGSRGYHRAQMRHGVSDVLRGQRNTLGIIFHDAR